VSKSDFRQSLKSFEKIKLLQRTSKVKIKRRFYSKTALFNATSNSPHISIFQSGEPLLAMILSAARGNKCVDTGVGVLRGGGGGGGDILAVLIECDETNFTT
jgi:hypothetical protein